MSWSTCRRVDWLYRHHWSAAINSTKQHETGSVITRYITCRCYEKEVPVELAIPKRHSIICDRNVPTLLPHIHIHLERSCIMIHVHDDPLRGKLLSKPPLHVVALLNNNSHQVILWVRDVLGNDRDTSVHHWWHLFLKPGHHWYRMTSIQTNPWANTEQARIV